MASTTVAPSAGKHRRGSASAVGQLTDPATVTVGPASAGAGRPTPLVSIAAVDELAAWLLSPHRDRHVLVITTAPGRATPFLDAEWAAAQWPDTMQVYVLGNGDLTRRLQARLPRGCEVFGGAVRLYPADRPWDGAPAAAPRFLAAHAAEGKALQDRLRVAVAGLAAADPRPSPRSAAYPSDGTVHRIDDEAVARDLAAHLLHPHRTVPVVAVSVHPNRSGPFVDAERIAAELRDVASVVVLGADASFGLTDGLGDRRVSVYFGAGRVYGVGTAWLADERLSTLRLCDAGRGPAVTDRLIGDGLAAAHSAGLLGRPDEHRPSDVRATAKVKEMLTDYQVSVQCDRYSAVMLVADLPAGIDPERLVAPGQRFSGRLRSGGALPRFIPDPPAGDPADQVRQALPLGSVALARVQQVDADRARLELHPDVIGTLLAEDGEDLRGLLTAGDVVGVEVWWLEEGLQLLLTELRDDVEPTPIPVLPGGPGWLQVDDMEPEQPEPEAAPALTGLQVLAGPSGPGPLSSELDRLRRQVRMMQEAAEEYQDRIEDLQEQVVHWRDAAKRAKGSARRAKTAAPRQVFDDPLEQIRHEIWLAYLERFAEAERRQRQLPPTYSFGPGFTASLAALQGISRTKVVQVLVEVLTGLDTDIPGRQLHPWRSGRAGEQQVRGDGARAWRVSMQVN